MSIGPGDYIACDFPLVEVSRLAVREANAAVLAWAAARLEAPVQDDQ